MEGSSQHDIGELLNAQRGIESEKITERKKWAATLRNLLDSSYIIDFIDAHSIDGTRSKSRGSTFTWSTLFKSLVGYVSREVEALVKLSDKPTQTTSAYSSRQTKKKDVGDMFRAYVRACNKRGPHLPLQEVLDHICSILETKRTASWLGLDYSQVLLHYILSVPHYVLQTTARHWDVLMSLYCDMFMMPHPPFDRTLLARMIHTLVCQSSSQCDVHTSKLYSFFTQALSNISHEKNPKVLEHLLASLNGFSRVVAPNARGRLCTLGESIFPALLHLWTKSQPAVKEQVVEFLQVQLSVHHPLGAHTDEEGAWASNDVTWNRNLEKLYDQIISDFESASRQVRWSGKSESSHRPEMIELASDVIHQVMYLRDVRNPSPETVQPRGKRRKSLTVWMALREGLDSSEDGPSAVLWLKLLCCLLSKWPQSLPPLEGPLLLSLLHKVQLETKRAECIHWLFVCLRALASLPTTPPIATPTTADLWAKIWASTLKTVSVHTSEDQGCALLTTLLQKQLVDCDLEPWKVLNAAANPPTKPLVSLLAAILRNHTLPESFQSSWTTPSATPTNDYPLRSQLLHFLLLTSAEGRVNGGGTGEGGGGGSGNGFQSESMKTESSSPPVGLMAHVLVALTQRSCSSAKLAYLEEVYTAESPTNLVLGETCRGDEWTSAERLFLDSTFDTPISLPEPSNSGTATITLSRENPIGTLKTLLLDLLGKRAELLSQPIQVEGSSPARDRAHQLSQLMSRQAQHCALSLHCLLLLCHCEVFPQAEQLRRTPLIKTLPDLLRRISLALRDALWNEVEKPFYYEVATSVLTSLGPLINFTPLGGCQLAPSVDRALQVVRRVCQLSFPTDLLDTIWKLARGKWPLPSAPPSIVSSNFSLGGSNASGSRPHSVASNWDNVSPSVGEEFTDLSMPDSDLSLENDTGLTSMTGVTDVLSPSALNTKTSCQLEAAQFLCCWYKSTIAVQGASGGDAPLEGGEDFDPQKAIVSMLSAESLDLSKASNVQLALKCCSSLASSQDQLRPKTLECALDVLGRVLTVHRKSQCVYCESLRVLAALARHFGAATENSQARERCTSLLSAFWKLYLEGGLHAPVRLELARAVHVFFKADPAGQWCSVPAKKKKDESLPLRAALVQMVNDLDHSVRMYMAKAVSSLYHGGQGVWLLLPRPDQEEVFQQVSEMLKKAHMVQTSQDDMSAEDESVNRVSSMISTLLCEAATAPACERKVVSILATAVGQGHIDLDLVCKVEAGGICKALSRLAMFLGYSSRRHFLEGMLVSLLKSWLKDGFAVTELPFQLWDFDSREAFLRAYAPQLAPYLVSCCDEAQLEALASLVATPLPSLLKGCLSSCMVFILPSYAQQDSSDSEEASQERRSRATASHNLLTRLLSDELVAATIQSSMDDFVVKLLVQMYEPHTADTHIAKYCRSCDPEPCPPHYSSMAVRATLDYLPSCYGKAVGTPFIRLLSKTKEHIQKILLSLALKIESTHRPFQKRRLFLAYRLFVSQVCKELGEGLEGTQAFVLRDIIYTIVRVLTVPEGRGREGFVRELFAPCCDTLLAVCKTAVEACPQELAHHLHTIVATLIPFAQRQTAEGKQALAVITYLVLKVKSEVIAEHVAKLDPFPDGELFATLREKQLELREVLGMESLEQEVDRFLSVSQEGPTSSRREGLKYLQKLLRSSRFGMAELLKSSANPVLRLIQGLVRLCQSGGEGVEGEDGLWVEVARCLGEIGPTDLRCIALPASREPHGLDISSLPSGWSHSACYCARILSLLTAMLVDKDIEVVRASAECLRAVLATKNGAAVLNKIDEQLLGGDWSIYLEPFKQPKKKKPPSTTSTLPPPTHAHSQPPSTTSTLPPPTHAHTQSPSTPTRPPTLPSPTAFPVLVDVADLWIPSGGVTHGNWITRLVTTLMDSGGVTDEVLLLLKPVCQVKVSLCEQTFPLLLHNILVADREDFRSILSRQVRAFFSSVGPAHGTAHQPGGIHPDSIRTVLDMVMYLRTVNRVKKGTPWENNFWLDLNFLDVAMAAQHCSAYFTSLLYIEIWRGATRDASHRTPSTDSSVADPEAMEVDHTHLAEQTSCLDNSVIQSLLLEAYSRIGEPDGLHGACATHTANEDTMTRMYEQEGQWQKSLSAYNLQMQLPGASCHSKLVESLQQLGLTHVLHTYLSGVGTASPQQSQELAEYRFQAAWRSSLWEKSCLQVASTSGGYHQSIYSCLTALKDGELGLLQSSLVEARSEVIRNLCSSGQESSSGVYPSLGRLLSLLELEEAGSSSDLHFLVDWKQRLPYMDSDFQFVEPVLALRSSVLHGLLVRSSHEGNSAEGEELPVEIRRKREGLFAALTETLLTQARMAREAGQYQVAEGALFALRHLDERRSTFNIPTGLQPSLHWPLQLEKAELHWERGEEPLAMGLLKTLLQQLGADGDPASPRLASLRPTALCLYGNWLAESHSKNPIVVMETYLEESVRLLEALPPGDHAPLLRAYLTLARYADSQYQRITRHMSSATFEAKRQLLQKSKRDLEKLTSHLPANAILKDRHLRTLRTQSEEDEITMSNLQQDKQQFLEKALKNYLLCLKTGDSHDLRVFRLCALWFANCTSPAVNELVSEGVSLLESRKFLPLMYQLAARMSARAMPTDPFQQTLQQIIYRTTLDHPHHCLYVILALSNASKDDCYPVSGHVSGTRAPRATGRLARKTSNAGTVDEDKVKAAITLLSRVRSEKPSLVQAVEQLCEAYIDLAYHDASSVKKQRGPIKLPTGCRLLKLPRMKEVAMPTIEIEVDPTCRYDNIVYIESFDTCFQLAGGVNLPKILSCQGSDGKRKRQLVKGKDDLRQDAVMQQVFLLVNRLLRKEPATIKRKLSIRTYKVIPLSQRSGIVEWCEGTRPLGEYLIATPQSPYQGAHHRYRPGDWSTLECRMKLQAAGNSRKGSKYNAYQEICAHFQPVFHHFFMEFFPSPSEWFERRLAYTRSVAASSIVGYIVGLGDRHVQNILIDTNTAEFIHIDLGVAFEQGKTLPTPETVPFRLTRDVVDGMGVEGVEGVFRRCCEETLIVMRASHEELRTIVEVLLYDPLYLWTISPLKALTLQRRADGDDTGTSTAGGEQIFEGEQTNQTANGSSSSSNKMAERVLLRLQEKLEGIEDGVPLSVSGQINHLIQEATDTANLCLLFAGWQPWI